MEVQLTSRTSGCFKCCGHCHYFLNSLATESPCDLIVLICQKKCNFCLENYCLMNCFIQLHSWWKFHITLKILGLYLDVFDSSQSPRRQRHKKAFAQTETCSSWIFKQLASITQNRKNISIQPLLLILLLIQVFHHSAFPLSTILWTIWVVHPQSCAAFALILERGLLSTIKSCCRLCKMTYGHCHHYLVHFVFLLLCSAHVL